LGLNSLPPVVFGRLSLELLLYPESLLASPPPTPIFPSFAFSAWLPVPGPEHDHQVLHFLIHVCVFNYIHPTILQAKD
jgi:hypothetical protein